MNPAERPSLRDVPEARRNLLQAVKRCGRASVAELTTRLEVSRQAVRQQIMSAQRDGLVEGVREAPRGTSGRPPTRYQLTRAGEDLFPKRYNQLAVMMIDTVAQTCGREALVDLLATITRHRVAALAPLMEGKSLPERLQVLTAVYEPDDPYIEVESTGDGYILRERNCPYLEVAMARPLLCSSTVSVLTQLLGCRVVREERFQSGSPCCSFRVLPSVPPPALRDGFAEEPEATQLTGSQA